jgi:hypothetical protein
MHRITALIGILALVGLAAACSSSSTTTSSSPTTTTGTETFTSGKVTSAKVLESNSPTLALTYTGVVPATGSFSLGGPSPTKGQTKTFTTSKGNLVLQVVSDSSSAKFVNAKTCLAQDVTVVHYTVVGDKSTGSFKDATGSGDVTVRFQSNSELKGKCSLANNAQPVTLTGAYVLFTGTGPMTVKS